MTRKLFIGFLILSATSIAILSMRYLSLEVTGILKTKSDILLQNGIYRSLFTLHITGGIIALLTAPLQLRSRRKFHKLIGRVYVSSVMLGGITGLVIAYFAFGGLAAQVGLGVLAVLWLVTTGEGLNQILRGNVNSHKKWMFRSIALTFGAVTFRICLLVVPALGYTFYQAYQVGAWSWLLNLIIIEAYIRLRKEKGVLYRVSRGPLSEETLAKAS